MNWKKAIIFGVLIWVLMFVIVSAFIGFKIDNAAWVQVLTPIIAGVIALTLAAKVRPSSAAKALSYGLAWVVVGIILDAIITMRFNSAIFSSLSLWIGYVLIFLAPLLKVKRV